jgi:2-dehydropantoate 2-reductase
LLNKPIHILGAGGMGVVLAWALAREGYSVILVDDRSGKVTKGRNEGITITGVGVQRVSFLAFDDWVSPDEGFVILCTKTYCNTAVLARLSDDVFLVPIQNGFEPELERRDHACEGIVSFVSECLRDRPVTRITRQGCLHIGARRSATDVELDEVTSLAMALGKAKLFPVKFVTDIQPYKATKLMYNAAISPLAAAAGVDNGELLTDRLAKKLFFGMLRENYSILQHAQIPLARIGPFHPDVVSLILRISWLSTLMALFFQPSLRGTYCSMSTDIQVNHARTEIDAYTGHLIRLAGKFPCPLNRAAYELVEKITHEGLKPQRKYLQYLENNLPNGIFS